MTDLNFPETKEHTYFVSGMHCASCELLIEKELLKMKNIKSVEAKTGKGEVTIEYEKEVPKAELLSEIFKDENYHFSDTPFKSESEPQKNDLIFIVLTGLVLILGFIGLNHLGLSSLVSINSKSSLPIIFVFGLLAGISSCAALVGGMVLSLSKQWNKIYSDKSSTLGKLQPYLLFNIGRIVSFGILGGVLGLLGRGLGISFAFTSFLVLGVSVLMFFMGLQMLGVKYFQKFQFTAPKFLTRFVADESNFQGKWMPAIMGALTFFLPCGFTITAQGLALLSGGPLQGALVMLAFVLGTTPMLLGIGLSSVKFSSRPHWANRFTKVAGILVLFFALFNLNSQMNVLGIASINDLWFRKPAVSAGENGLPPIVGNKQLIKMNASASGYQPNYFKVKVGVPVQWEITDTGTSGCTNAVISKSLFDGQISLTPGQVSTKEFTPDKPGKYKFSCWMGMITGMIEVVNQNGSTGTAVGSTQEVPSGTKGCGCGGGNGGSCGAAR